MKRRTYKLLRIIPVYGTYLKWSWKKGEIVLCSPLIVDLTSEGINPFGICKSVEEKYPGEVVTNERFWEEYHMIKSSK